MRVLIVEQSAHRQFLDALVVDNIGQKIPSSASTLKIGFISPSSKDDHVSGTISL